MSLPIIKNLKQMDFVVFFADVCLRIIKRDAKLREDAYIAYSKLARIGRQIDGIREAITVIYGSCDFEDETMAPFADAIDLHLMGRKAKKNRLTQEERKKLLEACGFICPHCGRELTKYNIDHIIPFYLVFDTLGDGNLECLCPYCNNLKSSHVFPCQKPANNQHTSPKMIQVGDIVFEQQSFLDDDCNNTESLKI